MKTSTRMILFLGALLGASSALASVTGFDDWCSHRTDVSGAGYMCSYDTHEECKKAIQSLSGDHVCLHKSDIPPGG